MRCSLYANLSERSWVAAAWSIQVAGRSVDDPGWLDLTNFERHHATPIRVYLLTKQSRSRGICSALQRVVMANVVLPRCPSVGKKTIGQPRTQQDRGCPNRGDFATHPPLLCRRSQLTVFRHDLWRDQADHKQDAERDKDHIVQIAQHGHEIGNEIDRRQSIACYGNRQCLRVPETRGSRLARYSACTSRLITRAQSLRQSFIFSAARWRPQAILVEAACIQEPHSRNRGNVRAGRQTPSHNGK